MKKTIFYSILVSLVVTLFSCDTDNRQITPDMLNFPPSEGSESSGNIPVLTFDSVQCNFGVLAIGEKFSHTYRFTNTGRSPLIISQVTPSCGCTTAKDWPEDPVMPGESGQISIEFNSKGFPGKIDKSITVLTNCIPKSLDLKLTGIVSGVEVVKPIPDQPFEMERER